MTITVLMLAGALFAQPAAMDHPQINRNAQPGMQMNSKLKPRLEWDGTSMDPMKDLELTAEQMQKLEQMKITQQKAMNMIDAELENLGIDLQQALKNENWNAAKQLNDQIYEKKRIKANTRITHREQIMNELTPEQKEKFRPMFDEMQYGCPNGTRHRIEAPLNRMNPFQTFRHMRRMAEMDGAMKCPNCQNMMNRESMQKPDCMGCGNQQDQGQHKNMRQNMKNNCPCCMDKMNNTPQER
jgi:Spy/CpxP family protein refolding chaperone